MPAVPAAITIGKLIVDDVNTVAHVWWDGARLRDRKGNIWTMNGTVPQVARNGRVPPGSGPFSDANYYSLGSGSDVLDFAGDFSAHFVIDGTLSVAGNRRILANSNLTTNGWQVVDEAGGSFALYIGTGAAITSIGSAKMSGVVNVISAGRSGGTSYLKVNLQATASNVHAYTPGTTSIARIGDIAGAAFTGTIYEIMATSTPFSEALAVAIQTRIKSKLGITAW